MIILDEDDTRVFYIDIRNTTNEEILTAIENIKIEVEKAKAND